ncbi:hypothetical protein H0O02_02145 [Candidatus Micrarchaeota archaeon]|nr:hypothetical protein [Candidatus Micrarchaeota archaeon]
MLYVSSPIAPNTAKLFFGIVKKLLEELGCRARIMGEPEVDFRRYRGNLLMPYVKTLAHELQGMDNASVVLNGNPGEIMLMALQEYPKLAKHINRMIFFNCSLHTGQCDEHMGPHTAMIEILKQVECTLFRSLAMELVARKFLDSQSGFSVRNAKRELRKTGYPDLDAVMEAREAIVKLTVQAGPGFMSKAMEDWLGLMRRIDYKSLYALHGEKMYCFCTTLDAERLKEENLANVFQMRGAKNHTVTLDRPVTTANVILDVLKGRYD